MLKIGNVTAPNNVVLAPMAGVCNPAFRLISKEFGCGLVAGIYFALSAFVMSALLTLAMRRVRR